MLIAAKYVLLSCSLVLLHPTFRYEEIYAPEVKDFVYITDRAYTEKEILRMEIRILSVLE